MQPPDTIRVGDTIPLHILVLNRSNDSIVGAPIILFSNNPDTVGIDTAKVAVVGKLSGTATVVARSGALPSAPLPIHVR